MLFRHDGPSSAPTESAAPGGLVVERPPPGLARGRYAASQLSILGLGALLVVGTLVYYLFRLRRRPRS